MSADGIADTAASLAPLRARLDEIDGRLVPLLADRFAVCREVAEHKRLHAIPTMQDERVQQVRARYQRTAAELGVPAGFISSFLDLLIQATCEMEDELIAARGRRQAPRP